MGRHKDGQSNASLKISSSGSSFSWISHVANGTSSFCSIGNFHIHSWSIFLCPRKFIIPTKENTTSDITLLIISGSCRSVKKYLPFWSVFHEISHTPFGRSMSRFWKFAPLMDDFLLNSGQTGKLNPKNGSHCNRTAVLEKWNQKIWRMIY